MTGDVVTEEEAEAPASPFAQLERPVVVWVNDPLAGSEEFDKLEEVVFKNEKIGLAMKAFRTVTITPEDAEADVILSGHGSAVPRLLVIDPVKEKVKVLEKNRLKVSSLYSAMKSAANRFWKEKVDRVVKSHLKLLGERDKLANQMKVLLDKEERYAEDERKLAEVKEQKEELEDELTELAKRERDMWKLTPKAA